MTEEIDEGGVEIAGYDVRIDVDDLRLLQAEIERLRAEAKQARVEALREAAVVCLRRVEELAEANCRNAAAQILALIDKEAGDGTS